MRCFVLVVAVAASIADLAACAAESCAEKARQAETTLGPKKAAALRAKCENRLAEMREDMAEQEHARQVEERRNAFLNRANAGARYR